MTDRLESLVAEWQSELDSGAIRDENARYCWTLAVRELRKTLAADRAAGIVRVDTRDEATVEHVARFLFERTIADQHYRWEDRPDHTQQAWRSDAEAVLATLRGETQP